MAVNKDIQIVSKIFSTFRSNIWKYLEKSSWRKDNVIETSYLRIRLTWVQFWCFHEAVIWPWWVSLIQCMLRTLGHLIFLATLWMSNVHNILSLAVLLSSCGLIPVASFMNQPISYLIFFAPVAFIFFRMLLPFSKNPAFSSCNQSRTALILSFCPNNFAGLICSRTHLFTFLVVHRALIQHCILNKSILSLSAFFIAHLLHCT